MTFGSHRSLRQNSYLSLLSLDFTGFFEIIVLIGFLMKSADITPFFPSFNMISANAMITPCYSICRPLYRTGFQLTTYSYRYFFYTIRNSFSCSIYLQKTNIPQIISGVKSQISSTSHPPAMPLCIIRRTSVWLVSFRE